MNARALSALLAFSLGTFQAWSAFAQVPEPTYVFMSWDSTAGFIQKQLGPSVSASKTISNWSFTVLGVPVTIPQIAISASAPVTAQQNPSLTVLTAAPLQIDVQVSNFAIVANLEEQVNGVTIHVSVNAQCTGPHLHLNAGSLTASVPWQLDHSFVDLTAGNVNISWNASDWTILGPQCQGLSGLDAVTQNLILGALSDPNAFAPQVQQALQETLNADVLTLKNSLPNLVQQKVLGTPVSFALLGVAQLNPYGLVYQVEAGLDASSLSSAPISDTPVAGVDWSQIPSPSFLVQNAGLSSLLTELFSRTSYTMNMNTVSSFEKLMGSWLLKLFLWPDLLNFSKTSAFELASQAVNNQVHLQLSNSAFQIQAEIGSWLMAQKDGQRWPYIYADSHLDSAGTFQLANSQMQVQLTHPSLQQTFTFGPDYVQRYHPVETFPSSIVQSAILQQISSQSLSFNLPTFQIPDDNGTTTSVSVRTFQQLDNFFVFSF